MLWVLIGSLVPLITLIKHTMKCIAPGKLLMKGRNAI